ncbi:hypothetical protein WP50_22585 [Lactiplantibacillus plantarum]|nr:hypothetical protein WP50_22585 [Lactiplantibacillus plantarum]
MIQINNSLPREQIKTNHLYASDAVDDRTCVDLCGRSEINTGNNLSGNVRGEVRNQLDGGRVVVIGTGANRIGTNHGNDYLVSQLLFYLKKADYEPVLINANPNSVAMTPRLTTKG